jgi:hypothetical protein
VKCARCRLGMLLASDGYGSVWRRFLAGALLGNVALALPDPAQILVNPSTGQQLQTRPESKEWILASAVECPREVAQVREHLGVGFLTIRTVAGLEKSPATVGLMLMGLSSMVAGCPPGVQFRHVAIGVQMWT